MRKVFFVIWSTLLFFVVPKLFSGEEPKNESEIKGAVVCFVKPKGTIYSILLVHNNENIKILITKIRAGFNISYKTNDDTTEDTHYDTCEFKFSKPLELYGNRPTLLESYNFPEEINDRINYISFSVQIKEDENKFGIKRIKIPRENILIVKLGPSDQNK